MKDKRFIFQQRSQVRLIRFDEQIVPNASLEDLDKDLWSKFIRSNLDDPVTVMRKLRLFALDSDGNEKATVGVCFYVRGTRGSGCPALLSRRCTTAVPKEIPITRSMPEKLPDHWTGRSWGRFFL